MSERHPIIAITGSSGAGTSTVTRTFSNTFRRENVRAAIIEGDSFHRYDRVEMKLRQAEAEKTNNKNFSHFGPENNLFGELESLFESYSESGQGRARKYLHNDEEAAPYQQNQGTFTAWEDLPPDTDGSLAAGVLWRQCRPHRLQPHQLQGLHNCRARPLGQSPELWRT
jgi:phosphoribulokinase